MVEPYWTSDNGETTLVVHQGHVLDVLRRMPAESVHCVVTSPPYMGLRDYKLESQVWDDGWRGSLGLEPTPDLYVQHLVDIFREVKRALRRDGTLWLNMGDCYAAHPGQRSVDDAVGSKQRSNIGSTGTPSRSVDGLKPKGLLGMPWRVSFALQADGWWLRQWLPWVKRGAMPDSAEDRPGSACEVVFLLTKSARYFYDAT